MKRFLKWTGIIVLILIIAGYIGLSQFVWPKVDSDMNPVIAHNPYTVSEAAQALHDELWIADLHADNLLWRRNPRKRNTYGHVDLPRLREGGVELQVFSTVTKSPRGLNFDGNDADAPDDITRLAQAQLWPRRTWNSIYERAAMGNEDRGICQRENIADGLNTAMRDINHDVLFDHFQDGFASKFRQARLAAPMQGSAQLIIEEML